MDHPTNRADLAPGTEFAGYRIESVLGRGGMSVVYLAEHIGLRRKVALKLLAPQLAEDPRFRDRFVRESQLAASIDHPNVIPIYEAGEAEGRLFIAMRYVEGTDLRAVLHEGRLEDARAISIIRQVAAGLEAAHARGLVHRDVKPGNVLLASTQGSGSQAGEHAYLSDFGLTKRAASESGVTGTGQFVGTLDYAAPEQFEGKAMDARTDVYSLGCVLYECLTGHAPFRRDNDAAVMYAHLLEERPALTSDRPELPEAIDGVVSRAMAKEPDDRYQGAGELAAAASGALGYATGETAVPVAVRRRRRRRPRWLVPAIAIAVVVGLVAVALPSVLGGGDEAQTAAATPAGMAIVDAQTGEQRAFVPRSAVNNPVEVVYEDGAFWVLSLDPIVFVAIDAANGRILHEISSPFSDVGYFAVDGNTLWVTRYDGPEISEVDIGLGREVNRFSVSDGSNDTGRTAGIAVGAGSLWVARPDDDDGRGRIGMVLRVDPENGQVERRFPAQFGVFSVAFEDEQVWTNGNGVSRIDPATNEVAARAEVFGFIAYIAAGGGFGWTAEETKGIVYRIGQNGTTETYRTGEGARSVSFADGVVWVGNQDEGTVTGIHAVTGEERTFRFEHPIQAVAAGAGSVLVQLNPGRTYEDRIGALEGSVAKVLITPYQLDQLDPATQRSFVGFQVAYATCARLLNHPDAAAPEGAELVPEVAASMPRVSADGRTYTFTVGQGYEFSPPSNEPVTAETFRSSIERALSPRIDGPGAMFLGDIEGLEAFRDGEADEISGLRAEGDTLSITLVEPSGDFLERLALPFFCPVPIGTPAIAGAAATIAGVGTRMLPSAGPYYVADSFNGEYLILKRNPNYPGPRPAAFDAIALREGVDPGQAVSRVQEGDWDGITNLYDPLLNLGGPLAGAGPGAEGEPRYFATPWSHTGYIAFNAGRGPFAEPVVRRAAALVLDRQALAAVWGQIPADDLLPPTMPGYADRDVYRLDGSALAEAHALIGDRTLTAVMGIFPDCAECREEAQIVSADLAQVGIRVRIQEFDNPWDAARRPGTEIDLLDVGSSLEFADPARFLSVMLLEDLPVAWLPPGVRDEVERVLGLHGSERIEEAAALADRLAAQDVPVAVVGTGVIGEYFSPSLGCLTFPPLGYGVDLAALCPAES